MPHSIGFAYQVVAIRPVMEPVIGARMCANKIVVGALSGPLLASVRSQGPQPFASAYPFLQFEGLEVATP